MLGHLEQGSSNQDIAEALTIEVGTVKNHVHSILKKLNVDSRKRAAMLARQFIDISARPMPQTRQVWQNYPVYATNGHERPYASRR